MGGLYSAGLGHASPGVSCLWLCVGCGQIDTWLGGLASSFSIRFCLFFCFLVCFQLCKGFLGCKGLLFSEVTVYTFCGANEGD